RIETTEVNAAVGVMTRPEFDPHDEILVRFLAHQIASDVLVSHLIGNDSTVGDVPVRRADLIPLIEVLAVEQGYPAVLRARRREGIHSDQTHQRGPQRNSEGELWQVSHNIPPVD